MSHLYKKGTKVKKVTESCIGPLSFGAGSLAALVGAFRRRALTALGAACGVLLAVSVSLAFTAGSALAQEGHVFETAFGMAGSGDGGLSLRPTHTTAPLAAGSGVAVDDTTGNLYVADTENHRVVEFSAAGSFIRAFGANVGGAGIDVCTIGCVAGTSTLSPGGFEAPTFVAVDNSGGASQGDVYIADGSAANEVQSLAVNATGGSFTVTFEGQTTGALPYNVEDTGGQRSLQSALEGLSTVGAQNVTVRKRQISPGESKYTIEFTGSLATKGVAQLTAESAGLSGGNATATVATTIQGFNSTRISKFDEEGDLVAGWGTNGQLNGTAASGGPFTEIDGITTDAAGDLIVYDGRSSAHNWFRFDASGSPFSTIKVERETKPAGIAVDSAGHLYKVLGFGLVEKYSASGADLGQVDLHPLESEEDTGFAIEPASDDVYIDNGGAEIIHYGPTCAIGASFPCSALEAFGSAQLSAAAGVTVASNGTVYVADTGHSRVAVFIAAVEPEATTEPATAFEQTSASLNGHLAPIGGEEITECSFEWGTTTAYGHTSPCAEGGTFSSASAVHADLTGLTPDTTYHFRLVASNSAITAHGQDQAFATTAPPLVEEEHISDLGLTTAKLHATVNPGGYRTSYYFQYGTTAAYGSRTTTGVLAASRSGEPIEATLIGLIKGTVYHYRGVAESECEPTANPGHLCVTVGPDRTFEALPVVSIRNLTTQTVGSELVTLKAELNPNSSGEIDFTVHYGLDSSYQGDSKTGTLADGSEFQLIEATFPGLLPNTTYHYQLIASVVGGEAAASADQTFTTEPSVSEERAAESCPNTLLREENSSLALPDCRAYEQVSPLEKNGYGITASATGAPVNMLAAGGERDSFSALGAFAGATAASGLSFNYVASRTGVGWVTQPTEAFADGPGESPAGFSGFAADLDSWVFRLAPGTGEDATQHPNSVSLFIGHGDGSFERATSTFHLAEAGLRLSPTLWFQPIAQSADFSRLFVGSIAPLEISPPDPRPGGGGSDKITRLYEVRGPGRAEPRLVAEVPLGLTVNGGRGANCLLDSSVGRAGSWASSDGSVLLYTLPLELIPGAECGSHETPEAPNVNALYALHGEASPIQLSAQSPSQCSSGHICFGASPANAEYDGLSPDGSLAWFTTTQPLIDGDADSGPDLYLAKLEGGRLSELVLASGGASSDASPGHGANVQGVVQLSADGTHIAFVATGVLTDEENALDQSALQGADNLYVYDATTDATKFVARLCSGPEESGSLVDSACDSRIPPGGNVPGADRLLWDQGTSTPEARLTPDGRFLLFSSYARLTPDDTDAVKDIYRYDFQTGELARVSVGRTGNDAGGNDDDYPAMIGVPFDEKTRLDGAAEDTSRSIAADGSVVIFETAAPLVSRDVNVGTKPGCDPGDSGCDIYEWQENGRGTCREVGGCVRLISDGVQPQGAAAAVISASGRDVTFLTAAGLVPTDTDGVPDIYDAREDGGFAYEPPAAPCSGAEICHGSVMPEVAAPHIATAGATGGNPARSQKCAKGKVVQKRHGQFRCVLRKHHKKHSVRKKKHLKATNRHQRATTNRGGGK